MLMRRSNIWHWMIRSYISEIIQLRDLGKTEWWSAAQERIRNYSKMTFNLAVSLALSMN